MGGASSCSHGDIHLFATQVAGTVTVNGAAFTGSTDQERASLVLRNAADDSAPLTSITVGDGSYSALIAPGSYDLYYQHSGPSVALPGNDFAVLQPGIVVGTEPLSLDIDVPVATITGTLTIAGKVFSDPTGDSGALLDLVSATSGRARLAAIPSDGGSFAALVIAGSYDAVYGRVAGSALPANYYEMVRNGIVVDRGAKRSLDIDIPSTTVTVSLTVNGAPATNQAYLILRHAPDQLFLEQMAPGTNSYFARAVPGDRYDLLYTGIDLAPNALLNYNALLQTGIEIGSAPVSLAVDVAATVVSGKVTLNGAPLPLPERGSLYLSTPAGDRVPLVAKDGSYSALVVPDTYDVYFEGASALIANLPTSNIQLQKGVVIGASPVTLDIQIPMPTLVSGKLTVNSAAIKGNHQYTLSVADSIHNQTLLAIAPTGDSYSALVFPGTYAVFFGTREDGVDLPHNDGAPIKTGIVVGTSPLTLDIDIPGATLSGVVTVNGELRSDTLAHLAGAHFGIHFANNLGSTQIANRLGDAGSYTSFLVPETYELRYGTDGKGHGLPSNHNLALGCLIVE